MQSEIVCKLEEVIKYLKPLLSLANCHMVNFITQNMWEIHAPVAIQKEISSVTVKEMDTIFFHFMKDSMDIEIQDDLKILIEKVPEFSNFLSTARDMSLRGRLLQKIITSHSEFNEKLTALGWEDQDPLLMEQFMSHKKMHEVQVMSDIVAGLANIKQASHVIDIGGGKGYLSSFLSLYHGLKILGVDSSQINTHGAAKRSKKLEKAWNGLCRRAVLLKQGSVPPRRGKHWRSHNEQTAENGGTSKSVGLPYTAQYSDTERKDLYKQVTEFVTPHTDLIKMIKEQFTEDECRNLSIVGLHTCGDLAPSCFRLFRNRPEVASICNIGCCYHLMEEKFSRNPFWDEVDPPLATGMYGFPLSEFLNSREFSFGRNARMLAAQAIDRLQENNQVQSESLFYRALLQVVLTQNTNDPFPWGQVGRLTAKSLSFVDYVQKAIRKLHLDIKVNEDEIEALYKEHLAEQHLLHIFFLLRVSLAPVIEAVILLDRLLYLYEQERYFKHLTQRSAKSEICDVMKEYCTARQQACTDWEEVDGRGSDMQRSTLNICSEISVCSNIISPN